MRFVDRTSPRTLVKLMTDGLLLRELESDPLLERYDTLILDEAHERNLNVDFLLGVCRRLVPQRPDLRVIVTSATIETRDSRSIFGGAPVIDVEGRSFPVEVRYRPLHEEDAEAPSLPEAVARCARRTGRATRDGIDGDALVFLPGEKQIAESRDLLVRTPARDWDVLPLYARLSGRGAGPDLRAAHASPRRARDQRRRDVADDSRRAVRRGRRARAHQPLQPAREVPAPADRARVAGERRPAQGSLRARGRGHLHPAVLPRRTSRRGRATPTPRSCAPTSRA